MWGGGMRQVGILAAAARYALQHHRARLAEDHAKAKAFGAAAAEIPGAHVDLARVETNIVNVDLDAPLRGEDVAQRAREAGLGVNASGPRRLRAVMHLDASLDDVGRGARILADVIAAARRV